MAIIGTVAETSRTPDLLQGTWTVTSDVAGGASSDLISFAGYDCVEWYLTVYTGYVSGSHTIGVSFETDGDGLVPVDPGRSIRATKSATTNQSGYLLYPPASLAFSIFAVGVTVTAFTVAYFARPSATRGSRYRGV